MLQLIFDNLFLGIILLIMVGILYLPIYFLLRKKQIPILKQMSWIGLAGIVFIILFATILFSIVGGGVSFNPPRRFLNLVPFRWIFETYTMGFSRMMSQVISNMLMFVPLGFLLPVVFKNFRSVFKTTILGFLFSFSIEVIQYFIGRSADIDDLILNTLGGIIGYGIFILFNKCLQRKNWWYNLLN